MIQQTVVVTSAIPLTTAETLAHINSLLPINVQAFLNECASNGTRTTVVTKSDGIVTVANQWDETAAAEYKTLMASVSDGVIESLNNDGWTITFTPMTADL